MFEADLNRRYHMAIGDKLRRQNMTLVVAAWVLALIGALLTLGSGGYLVAGAGFVIAASATTTLRDVLRYPDRISDSRLAVRGINQELDSMRLLWETDGMYRPPAECESFRNVSFFQELSGESLDQSIVDAAEEKTRHFYERMAAADTPSSPTQPPSPSPTQSPSSPSRQGDCAGVPMRTPPPPPPTKTG